MNNRIAVLHFIIRGRFANSCSNGLIVYHETAFDKIVAVWQGLCNDPIGQRIFICIKGNRPIEITFSTVRTGGSVKSSIFFQQCRVVNINFYFFDLLLVNSFIFECCAVLKTSGISAVFYSEFCNFCSIGDADRLISNII